MENKVKNKKWNLEKIAKDYSLSELLEKWNKVAIHEINTRKEAVKSLTNFKKWWSAYIEYELINDKVQVLAGEFSKKDKQEQTDEQKDYLDEKSRIGKSLNERVENLPSIWNVILKNKKKIFTYLKDKDLSKYKTYMINKWYSHSDHLLSAEDDRVLKATWELDDISDIYNSLWDDKFGKSIVDENNIEIEDCKWIETFKCDNPAIRKNSYIAWYDRQATHRNTLFTLVKLAVNRMNQKAKLFKYKTWIEAQAHMNYQLNLKNYYYIIDQVDKFAPINVKLQTHTNKLIAYCYGLETIEPWDEELEIDNTNDKISNKEAMDDIYKALSCLGEDYKQKIDICVNNNVINWDKNCNVSVQGYCISGTNNMDENPINFNWDGTSISASTLAHELGHNIRNKFMKQYNEIDNTSNFLLDEIPSIVNSVLIALYYINKFKKNNAPKSHLYGIYTNFLGYMFDCISYNGFILQLFDRVTQVIIKSKFEDPGHMEDFYCKNLQLWYGMTKSEFKKQLNKYPYQIENLKVYTTMLNGMLDFRAQSLSYYIGAIVAIPVAFKIFNGDKQTLNKYIKFLKSGTSIDPTKVLKDTLGINILKPDIYTEAKQKLESLVNQFIKDIKVG